MSDGKSERPYLALDVPVEIWLTSERVPLSRLLDLEPGSAMPRGKDPDAPVDLVVNGNVMASGELVVVDGKFGLRITSTGAAGQSELGGAEPAAEAPPEEPGP